MVEEVNHPTSVASPSHPMEAHPLAARASLPHEEHLQMGLTGCKEADLALHSIQSHHFKRTKKMLAVSTTILQLCSIDSDVP